VITNEEPETIQHLEWGLVPSWADDDSGGLINAGGVRRREAEFPGGIRATEMSGSRGRLLRVGRDGRRDAAPIESPSRTTGCSQWPASGSAGNRKRHRRGSARLAAASTTKTEAGPLETFTVITTEPNDLVADLHHRMAVILDPAAERRWLAGEDPADLLEPSPADGMRAYPVSTAVNDPSTDEPSLVDPLESA